MGKSVGNVSVEFVAKTAGFKSDVKAAADSVKAAGEQMAASNATINASTDRAIASVEKGFLKVALGAHVYGLIRHELQDVIKNIDSIPDVPESTLDSIHRMKYSLDQAGVSIKGAIATMAGWFQQIGEGIGYSLGALIYGSDAAADALAKMNDEAREFAAKKFNEEFKKLTDEMNRSKLSAGELGNALNEEAGRLAKFASGTIGTQQERWDAGLKAQKNVNEALKIYVGLKKDEDRIVAEIDKSEEDMKNRRVDPAMRVRELLAQRDALANEAYSFRGNTLNKLINPVDEEMFLKIEKARLAVNKELGPLLLKLREPMTMLRDTFTHSFEGMGDAIAQFVVNGKSQFRDLFKTIVEQMLAMFVKLSLINPLLNSVFKLNGTKDVLPSLVSFAIPGLAIGGRPNPGEMSIVGENGPELFVPDGTGTVIPNGALGGGGGASVVNHFNWSFGAGVTSAQVLALIPSIIEQTKSAVADSVQRGGGYRRAFT
jgi:phage-related minor tail protein